MQGLNEVQFLLEVVAAKRRESRLAKMLGEQLGSYLSVETLDSLFGISRVEPSSDRSFEDVENEEDLPKAVTLPLVLALKPELQDVYKEKAKEILDRRAEIEAYHDRQGDQDPFGLQKFDLEMLEAVARLNDKQREVARARGDFDKEDAEMDAVLGIYPPGGAPDA